jgi:hypothetical protein
MRILMLTAAISVGGLLKREVRRSVMNLCSHSGLCVSNRDDRDLVMSFSPIQGTLSNI